MSTIVVQRILQNMDNLNPAVLFLYHVHWTTACVELLITQCSMEGCKQQLNSNLPLESVVTHVEGSQS
ncbi:hypothetical protein QQF64_006085 [Cirrhinus molitorella]|uniref:Uncharacterized protein n=1 Tax=Cirrhinus molitorella TaxID=172907 RepID=A0ABR3ME60_9TELE